MSADYGSAIEVTLDRRESEAASAISGNVTVDVDWSRSDEADEGDNLLVGWVHVTVD